MIKTPEQMAADRAKKNKEILQKHRLGNKKEKTVAQMNDAALDNPAKLVLCSDGVIRSPESYWKWVEEQMLKGHKVLDFKGKLE